MQARDQGLGQGLQGCVPLNQRLWRDHLAGVELFIPVFDNRNGREQLGVGDKRLRRWRQDRAEHGHAASVKLDCASVLAKADDQHLAEAAFDRPAETGMRLDPVYGDDVVRLVGILVAIDRHAIDIGDLHDVHRGPDRRAGISLAHAIAFEDLLLAFRRAAAMTAHGRHQKRLGARLFQLIHDRLHDRRLRSNAPAADSDGDGFASEVDMGEFLKLQRDVGVDIGDLVRVESLDGATHARQGSGQPARKRDVDGVRDHV